MGPIAFTVNGTATSAEIRPNETLLELLRDGLQLKGAKEGCGVGVCGSCTVLVDGRPVSSCLMLATNAEGKDVVTIEGLAEGERLHPVQQAFLDATAFQCGFCTAGLIMGTVGLLQENPDPSEEEVKDYLSGNICRCGTYLEVLQAVKAAAATLRAS